VSKFSYSNGSRTLCNPAGLHNVRLPFEYENLLTLDLISFEQLQACQRAAFRHAFAWPHAKSPAEMLHPTPPAVPTPNPAFP
ncbi:MAG: hypothetical protein AAFY15_15175, partial [Cyanobacteria bacterium J06648_11]